MISFGKSILLWNTTVHENVQKGGNNYLLARFGRQFLASAFEELDESLASLSLELRGPESPLNSTSLVADLDPKLHSSDEKVPKDPESEDSESEFAIFREKSDDFPQQI